MVLGKITRARVILGSIRGILNKVYSLSYPPFPRHCPGLAGPRLKLRGAAPQQLLPRRRRHRSIARSLVRDFSGKGSSSAELRSRAAHVMFAHHHRAGPPVHGAPVYVGYASAALNL